MTREDIIDYLNGQLHEIAAFCNDSKHVDEQSERDAEAINFALQEIKRVKELEAENIRLKEGIANVKAEIEKYTAIDICKVSHVLQIIKKYLGE